LANDGMEEALLRFAERPRKPDIRIADTRIVVEAKGGLGIKGRHRSGCIC
jgi:hypothetical protein